MDALRFAQNTLLRVNLARRYPSVAATGCILLAQLDWEALSTLGM
jgi:hypothetical protein